MATKTYKVSDFSVGAVTGTDRTAYAQWKFNRTKTACNANASGYILDWEYYVGGSTKRWFEGSYSTVSKTDAMVVGTSWLRSTYTAPSEANAVRCKVIPVSKTHTVKKKDVKYFSAGWSGLKKHSFLTDALPKPTVGTSLDDDGQTVTISVSCSDNDCHYCDVKVTDSTGKKQLELMSKKWCPQGSGSYRYKMAVGATCKFTAMCFTTKKGDGASSWATTVSETPKPATPTIDKASASSTSSTAATVTWKAASGATTYTAEYVADSSNYFNTNPEAVRSASGITGTTFTPTDLESGHTWFFRVKAVNSTGSSGWSGVVSAVVATVPDAPTTYETYAAYITGDSVNMRWTHNSEDNSDQTAYTVSIKVTPPGGSATTTTRTGTTADHISYSTSNMADGSMVSWKVKTKGAHANYSPYSVERSFMVYQQPSIIVMAQQTDTSGDSVTLENPLVQFPLCVTMNPSGGGNVVAGYHLSICLAEALNYTDIYGNDVYLGEGDVVFDKDYSVSDDPYTVYLTAADVSLQDEAKYTVKAEASMASGLRSSSSTTFLVSWECELPEPSVSIAFFDDTLTADVIPSCYDLDANGEPTDTLTTGVTLSVLRLGRDGELTLLQSGIENSGYAVVTDPHAAFDECWYRVLVVDDATGVANFIDSYDLSPHPTCTVQWDENWQHVDAEETEDGSYDYSGLRIDGLYNLQFGESGDPQAEDVEYIGRKHPVSYYGTQTGYRARYSVIFPKDDSDTLWKARRLLSYLGDFYIRESSGTGFWAHLSNRNLSRTHDGLSYSLSFDAVRNDRTDVAL